MRTVFEVACGSSACTAYPVLCGNSITEGLAQVWCDDWQQVALVTDSNTAHLFLPDIQPWAQTHARQVLVLSVPPGESAKTRETKAKLEDQLLEAKFDRHACIVAIGGGVILDLAGFVASTYLRGIAHINVATSLLAQVDAAIGGKTGINTPNGKNLIGSFYPPRAVLLAYNALNSLPAVELRNGLAELVKHAVIADATLFYELLAWVMNSQLTTDTKNFAALIPTEELLLRSVATKTDIVSRDEREGGLREILNFGHTIGHSIEGALNHTIPHGQAVAIGMIVEGTIAHNNYGFPEQELTAIRTLLRNIGLPTVPPCTFEQALPYMASDKKNRGGQLHCALPTRIGTMVRNEEKWSTSVTTEEVRVAWSQACSA